MGRCRNTPHHHVTYDDVRNVTHVNELTLFLGLHILDALLIILVSIHEMSGIAWHYVLKFVITGKLH